MYEVHLATAIAVLLGVLIVLPRTISGPTLIDRILAVNIIGTKTIVLLALVGFMQADRARALGASAQAVERAGFWLDIALAYSLINFVATVAVLKYLERRARSRPGGTS